MSGSGRYAWGNDQAERERRRRRRRNAWIVGVASWCALSLGLLLWFTCSALTRFTTLSRAIRYTHQAEILSDQGRPAEAVELLRTVIALSPDSSIPYKDLGAAYNRMGRPSDAVECFTKAIELNPGYRKAHYNRAESYRVLGRRDAAIADYTRTIELDPKFVTAYIGRGIVYSDMGNQAKAIADYNAALAVSKRLFKVRAGRGSAVEQARREQSFRQEWAATYADRGMAYCRKGLYKRGIPDFQESTRLDPQQYEAWWSLAMTYDRIGKPDEAIEGYLKFSSSAPKNTCAARIAQAEAIINERLGQEGPVQQPMPR